MLTLNQIKYTLTEWFNNHAQINSTYYCDDFDFNSERSISYPVTNIEYLDSNVKDKETTHTFKLVLADLVDQNISGHEDEIQSDMLMIAEDFFAWAQYTELFNFQKSVNIQKFMDDTDDRTSGIVFKIQLTVIRSQNTCQIPYKITPDGITGFPTCVNGIYNRIVTNRQTVNYTAQLIDRDVMVEMNLGIANNFTVPNHSNVPFRNGTVILGSQYGIGTTTILTEAGVTLRAAGGRNQSAEQYSVWVLFKIDTNEWYLYGDLM